MVVLTKVSKNSPVGFGWASTYAITATETASGTVYVTNEDGRWDLHRPSGGTYVADAGANADLAKIGTTRIALRA